MSNDVLVSVIVPAKDRAATIARSIRSALAQSVPDLEVLVVDDGSTDGTAQAARSADDGRVRVLAKQDPTGPSAARNYGADHARGRYLAFLDSDDEWHRDKLRRQLSAMRPPAGLALCGFVALAPGRHPSLVLPGPVTPRNAHKLLDVRHAATVGSTLVMTRDRFERGCRFDEDLPTMEDLDLTFRISQEAPVAVVRQALVVKHTQPASAWSGEGIPMGRARFVEKHREMYAQHPKELADSLAQLAVELAAVGREAEAVSVLQDMPLDDIGSIRRLLHGGDVVSDHPGSLTRRRLLAGYARLGPASVINRVPGVWRLFMPAPRTIH